MAAMSACALATGSPGGSAASLAATPSDANASTSCRKKASCASEAVGSTSDAAPLPAEWKADQASATDGCSAPSQRTNRWSRCSACAAHLEVRAAGASGGHVCTSRVSCILRGRQGWRRLGGGGAGSGGGAGERECVVGLAAQRSAAQRAAQRDQHSMDHSAA